MEALDALRARDWEGLARRLHPDVVHRTPGVPEPILGREAFVLLSRQAVAKTPDVTFEVERIVTDGETGFLSETGDVEKMSEDAARLLMNEEMRREMGRRARESAIERYSTDLVIPQYIKFYERVLAA